MGVQQGATRAGTAHCVYVTSGGVRAVVLSAWALRDASALCPPTERVSALGRSCRLDPPALRSAEPRRALCACVGPTRTASRAGRSVVHASVAHATASRAGRSVVHASASIARAGTPAGVPARRGRRLAAVFREDCTTPSF